MATGEGRQTTPSALITATSVLTGTSAPGLRTLLGMATAQVIDFTKAYRARQGNPPRVRVTGTVYSVKLEENDHGSRWRFLVVTTDGESIWCSVPVALQQAVPNPSDLLRRMVSFEARICRLPEGDLLYGTHPSKASLHPLDGPPVPHLKRRLRQPVIGVTRCSTEAGEVNDAVRRRRS